MGVEKQDLVKTGLVASTSSQPQPPYFYIISPARPLEALEFILPAKLIYGTIWSLMRPVHDYCVHSFIHSFTKHLLSTYYIPATVLDAGGTGGSKTDVIPALGLY